MKGDILLDPFGSPKAPGKIVADPFGDEPVGDWNYDDAARRAAVITSGAAKEFSDAINPLKVAGGLVSLGQLTAGNMLPFLKPYLAQTPVAQDVTEFLNRAGDKVSPMTIVEGAAKNYGLGDMFKNARELAEADTKTAAAKVGTEYTPGLKFGRDVAGGIGGAAAAFLPLGAAAMASRGERAASGMGKLFLDPIKARPVQQTALNLGVGATAGAGKNIGEVIAGPEGALPGVIAGTVIPAGVLGLTGLVGRSAALQGLKTKLPQTIAEQTVLDTMGGPQGVESILKKLETPAPFNAPFTMGQRTGSVPVLSAERMLEQNPGVKMPPNANVMPGYAAPEAFKEAKAAATQAIKEQGISPLAPFNNPLDASENLASKVRTSYEATKGVEKGLWDAATQDFKFPRSEAAKFVAQTVADMGGEAADIPSKLLRRVEFFPKMASWSDIDGFRKAAQGAAREAAQAGNPNTARIIGNFASKIDDWAGTMLEWRAGPEATAAANAARQYTAKTVKGAYENTPIGNTFKNTGPSFDPAAPPGMRRQYDLAPTEVGGQIVKTGPGGPEKIDALLKIGDPAAVEAGRHQWASGLWKFAPESADGNFAAPLKAASMRQYIAQSRPMLDRLYSGSPAGKQLIDRLDTAVDMISRAAPPAQPGTDTAVKMATNMKAGTIADAAIAKILDIPSFGNASKMLERIGMNTREKAMGIVLQALLEPDGFGRSLLTKATQNNLMLAAPGIRKAIAKSQSSMVPAATYSLPARALLGETGNQ